MTGAGAGPPDAARADALEWTTRRIRRARPPRAPIDAGRPAGHVWETERRVGGGERRALTVFLTGAECPFTCLFCDLWRHTIEGPTRAGAIPAQLEAALESHVTLYFDLGPRLPSTMVEPILFGTITAKKYSYTIVNNK